MLFVQPAKRGRRKHKTAVRIPLQTSAVLLSPAHEMPESLSAFKQSRTEHHRVLSMLTVKGKGGRGRRSEREWEIRFRLTANLNSRRGPTLKFGSGSGAKGIQDLTMVGEDGHRTLEGKRQCFYEVIRKA